MDICIKSNKKVRKMTNSFIFEKYNFNKGNGVLSLHYLSGGYHFEEIITFPNAPFDADDNLIDECVRLLHLAAGISYYKALLPENIEIKTSSLSKKEADFFNHFYILIFSGVFLLIFSVCIFLYKISKRGKNLQIFFLVLF